MNRNRARSATRAIGTRNEHRRITDLVIEAAWITGVVLVPLVFNPRHWFSFYNDPKYAVLHLVALVIIAAWAWEWALYSRTASTLGVSNVLGWAARRPERWAVISAFAFALVAVVSTGLSPVPAVSLWGRDFTDLGYELYSTLAFVVVFLAIAIRMRKGEQMRRLMLMLSGTGTVAGLYGISQRFEWDPLGPGEGADRVFASFGNPILLGSFLVMTAAITTAVALGEHREVKYGWLVAGVIALGVQLAALWYTGSRGPWIGYGTGVIGFAVIGYVWLDRRTLAKGLAMIAAGVLVAVVISIVPGAEGGGRRDLADLGGIFDDSTSGSMGGRSPIWESAFELSVTRAWVPEESGAIAAARTLVGYGPEMFYYAYPLGLEVDQSNSLAQHTHNFPLQILLELGLLGLTTFLAMALLAVYAGVRTLGAAKRAGGDSKWLSILVVGLLAALVGRGMEQMAGVARVGDLLPFWAVMGLLIAAVEIARRGVETNSSGASRRSRSSSTSDAAISPSARYVIAGIALAVTVLAAGLLYYRDFRTLQASAIARDARDLIDEGRPNEGLAKIQRAVGLNPDVEPYHLLVNDLFRKAADEAEATGDREIAVFGWESALEAAHRFETRNPKAFDTQLRLGQAESRLVALGRDDLIDVARSRYIKIAAGRPSYPSIQADAAQGLLAIGDDTLGLVYADRAIDMETAGSPNPEAWWFRGVALENLGELDTAAVSYETVVERAPLSKHALNSHRRLAVVYDRLGDPGRAEEERALADAFE
ncbi:MAG: O-antigen ligase family protein [Dehalococcoidia bacterium]|nr:hypothetical protein [Chloroflexota bacterium]MDP5876104.1 O-antigen ligase family protein [Dehalococcoidia bacterium]MDP7161353.1 O-antigen ligase family protein [Dehalococcoidia bacterium]MDP7213642.1 O-antigen ligase family protein [Dehalococcoidia bacterium]MDP7515026.1 O-antigen ligase family protein [Dehalococcoidia bacterium]